MSRARCRAVAKTATAPPLWRAIRRKEAPRAVLERSSEVAAIRRTPAMRLAPRPLRLFFKGLPPEIGVRGHRRNHDTKWSSDGKAARWGPTSVRTTWAAPARMPSTRVKSTPANRQRVVRAGCAPRALMAFSLAGLGWGGTGSAGRSGGCRDPISLSSWASYAAISVSSASNRRSADARLNRCSSRQVPVRYRAISAADFRQRGSRCRARRAGSRSPPTMARTIAIPVTPVRSVTARCTCTFI